MLEYEWISKSVVTSVLVAVAIIEALGGLYLESKRSKNDWALEMVSLVTLPTLIQPAIFFCTFSLLEWLWPAGENSLIDIGLHWQIMAFLVLDDMMQYWWHRLSHHSPTMWKLHRPHHLVEEMGVIVTYRSAFVYYALMPGIWFSAMLVYLGMGYIYLFYLPIKLTVILLAHSETRWDRFLYRYKILHPIAWLIERTISTPSTHFAHHGLTEEDGISHPNGNFGNLLFFWDILFGTAKITRQYPTTFGAWNRIKEPWHVQLLFPLIRSKDPESELHQLFDRKEMDDDKNEAKSK